MLVNRNVIIHNYFLNNAIDPQADLIDAFSVVGLIMEGALYDMRELSECSQRGKEVAISLVICNHTLWLYLATEEHWFMILYDLWDALPCYVALYLTKTSLAYRKGLIRKLLLILHHPLLQLLKPHLSFDLRDASIGIIPNDLINFLKRVVILHYLLMLPILIPAELLNLILILWFLMTAAPSHL